MISDNILNINFIDLFDINNDFKNYFISALILISSLILGFLLKKIIILRIKKIVRKTKLKSNDVFLEIIYKGAIPIFLVLGIYISIQILPLEKKIIYVLTKISIIIIILTITLLFSRILNDIIKNYTQRKSGLTATSTLFSNIARIITFIIGFLIILQYMGISIVPILGILGVGGLAVGLALQDTLTNLFSGINILASKQIKTGDYIKLDSNDEGFVIDITWRYTTIKTLPNNHIIIPNSKLASAIITNYNMPETYFSIPISILVSDNSDLDFVEKVAIEVAQKVSKNYKGAFIEEEPMVRFKSFETMGIGLNVILKVKEFSEQFEFKHIFIKEIYKKFKELGIKIPFQNITIENYKH